MTAAFMLALTLAGAACTPAPRILVYSIDRSAGPVPDVLVVEDVRLEPGLRYLLARSPRVRASLDALASGRPRIRVFSYATAPQSAATRARYSYAYTIAHYSGERSRIDSVDVALDLARLRADATTGGVTGRKFRAELAILLAHEIYGHAVPLLESGTAAGECRDELPDGRSCAVARENEVRGDLGLPARHDYHRIDLELTRRRDEAASRQGSRLR